MTSFFLSRPLPVSFSLSLSPPLLYFTVPIPPLRLFSPTKLGQQ